MNNEELEKEIKKFLNDTGAPYYWCNDAEQKDWCETIARHFAQWQEEQDKETIELAEDHAYFAGAVNEREKIMKEAVDGEVWNYASNEDLRAIPIWGIDKFRHLKDGDKVKVIILED